jgi:ABC-type multidrug transport system permease subunit
MINSSQTDVRTGDHTGLELHWLLVFVHVLIPLFYFVTIFIYFLVNTPFICEAHIMQIDVFLFLIKCPCLAIKNKYNAD